MWSYYCIYYAKRKFKYNGYKDMNNENYSMLNIMSKY